MIETILWDGNNPGEVGGWVSERGYKARYDEGVMKIESGDGKMGFVAEKGMQIAYDTDSQYMGAQELDGGRSDSELMTEESFAGKVSWEGGIWDALTSYGLHERDLVPGELHDAWKKLREAVSDISPLIDDVEAILGEYGE